MIDVLLLFHFLESTDLNCKQYNTCTDCIVSSPECTWCEDIVSLDFLLSFLYGQKVDKYKKSKKLSCQFFKLVSRVFQKKYIPENRTFSFKNAEKTLKTINMEDEA